MSYFFRILGKNRQNLSSAAVVKYFYQYGIRVLQWHDITPTNINPQGTRNMQNKR